ncbi:MAG: alpha/beta fold hydrolase [Acidimicrobiia bacterium]|nr:alpha/beta fold hydrolase [Acidimicrobiia bacterium]
MRDMTETAEGTLRMPRAWSGPHRQTLRRHVLRDAPPMPAGAERIDVHLPDGDVLAVSVNWPRIDPGAPLTLPLAVVVHGLGGSAQSPTVRATARHLHDLGFGVARVDMRGCGDSSTTTRGAHHAGRSADLAAVLDHLSAVRPELCAAGVVLVGISLGGVLVLNLLGGQAATVARVRAAATVSAPLDLVDAAAGLARPRAWGYRQVMLRSAKRQILRPAAALTRGERARIADARSFAELDDVFIAGAAGYAGAYAYWRGESPLQRLHAIGVPTLAVHAADDPVIVDGTYARAGTVASGAAVTLELNDWGGHAGFHAAGDPVAWADRRIASFLRGVLFEGTPL